jgi:hypothetical protein
MRNGFVTGRIAAAVLAGGLLCSGNAWAVTPNFLDNFDNGVGGDIVWAPWGNAPGDPSSPNGINNLVTSDGGHDHTPGPGAGTARVFASDPAAWNGYADFGSVGGPIYSEAFLFEDYSNNGSNSAQPVTNMLALFGAAANPNVFTDYIQLGVVSFFPGGSATYGFRTRYNDSNALGIINTGVSRKAGVTKLAIEVDALADGGQVRFFIDNALVGSSFRAGANAGAGGLSPVNLQYVRIGNNSKSYENFWYDDVQVVPEPTAAALLGLGAFGALTARRRRA